MNTFGDIVLGHKGRVVLSGDDPVRGSGHVVFVQIGLSGLANDASVGPTSHVHLSGLRKLILECWLRNIAKGRIVYWKIIYYMYVHTV